MKFQDSSDLSMPSISFTKLFKFYRFYRQQAKPSELSRLFSSSPRTCVQKQLSRWCQTVSNESAFCTQCGSRQTNLFPTTPRIQRAWRGLPPMMPRLQGIQRYFLRIFNFSGLGDLMLSLVKMNSNMCLFFSLARAEQFLHSGKPSGQSVHKQLSCSFLAMLYTQSIELLQEIISKCQLFFMGRVFCTCLSRKAMWEGLSQSPSKSLSSFLDSASRFLKLQLPDYSLGLSMNAFMILIRSSFQPDSNLKHFFRASAITIWPTRYMHPHPTSDYMLLSSTCMLSLYENHTTLPQRARKSYLSLGSSRSKDLPRIQAWPWSETWSMKALNLQERLVPNLVSYFSIIISESAPLLSYVIQNSQSPLHLHQVHAQPQLPQVPPRQVHPPPHARLPLPQAHSRKSTCQGPFYDPRGQQSVLRHRPHNSLKGGKERLDYSKAIDLQRYNQASNLWRTHNDRQDGTCSANKLMILPSCPLTHRSCR